MNPQEYAVKRKTLEGKLSPIEAVDLVRAMGRDLTYSQAVEVLQRVHPESSW